MDPTLLRACDHFDPALPAEESARRLADAAIGALEHNERLHIDFSGVPGVASSYYNIVLSRIATAMGSDALLKYLSYDFDTTTHRTLFERSLAAFRRAAG